MIEMGRADCPSPPAARVYEKQALEVIDAL